MARLGALECAKHCPYQRDDLTPPCGVGMAVGAECGMSKCDTTAATLEQEITNDSGVVAVTHTAGQHFATFYSTKNNPPVYGDWRTWDMVIIVADGQKVDPKEYLQSR